MARSKVPTKPASQPEPDAGSKSPAPSSTPVSRGCRIGMGIALFLYGLMLIVLLATGWGELTDLKSPHSPRKSAAAAADPCDDEQKTDDADPKADATPATPNDPATPDEEKEDDCDEEESDDGSDNDDDDDDASSGQSCCFGWSSWLSTAPPETRLIVIVILASAIGAYIHTCTSFADYVGNQKLAVSWLWWYVQRPIIGVGIGLLTYFAYRTGMLSAAADASILNPFGIAAVSGLAGMFSKKAADALSALFDTLVTTPGSGDNTREAAISDAIDEKRKATLTKQSEKNV